MMTLLRNPLIWVGLVILGFLGYQSLTINKLTQSTSNQATVIERLETSITTANDNLVTLADRMAIQSELVESSVNNNRNLNNEYKAYIDHKFTSTGGMLLNIQRQVGDLSDATGSTTPTTGDQSPIYIELPPAMGRAILGLLRDADEDRLASNEWSLWYCKHNPNYPKCKEWFP